MSRPSPVLLDNSAAATPDHKVPDRTRLDDEVAPLMFIASGVFLALLAALLHLSSGDLSSPRARICLTTLAIVYAVFPLEFLWQRWVGGRWFRDHWWALLIPPLRLATRDHGAGKSIWLPWVGWQVVDRELERWLHERLNMPMILLAVAVLPLIISEFIWATEIEAQPALRMAFHSATGLIWMAFVAEYVVMISVTANKGRYIVRNWIDAVVILLPLVAFLRSVRMARLLRLNQVSRSVRLYRVRGVLLRTWRAIVALDLLERWLIRDPAERLRRLRETLDEKEHELTRLRKKISELELVCRAPALCVTTSPPLVEEPGAEPFAAANLVGVPERVTSLATRRHADSPRNAAGLKQESAAAPGTSEPTENPPQPIPLPTWRFHRDCGTSHRAA